METLCNDLQVTKFPSVFYMKKDLSFSRVDVGLSYGAVKNLIDKMPYNRLHKHEEGNIYDYISKNSQKRIVGRLMKHYRLCIRFWFFLTSNPFAGVFLVILNGAFVLWGWVLSKKFADVFVKDGSDGGKVEGVMTQSEMMSSNTKSY